MSGKQSRRIRKAKGFSKKAVAGAAAALLCAAPLAPEGGEFLVSLFPELSFPVLKFDSSLSMGFGGGLRLTYRPTDFLNVFVEGGYKQYSFDTKQSVGSLSVLEGGLGAGWHLPLNDRMGMDFDAGVGYYNSQYSRGNDSSAKTNPVQGINLKGSVSFSYKISPSISVFASAAADHYAYKNAKFLTSADVNPGLTINLTKAFSSKSEVQLGEQKLKPVFPVFYSWYNDNSFGTVEILNEEDAAITDVNVFFYQSQYMNQPQNCGSAVMLPKGGKMTVDLKAFFNEQMLDLNEKTDSMSSIIVEYKYLGRKYTTTFPMVVPVYGRNNMSWEDDRCASAFVSSKDPAAMWFSKYVLSTVRDNVRSGVPQNIQYAMAIFEALDQFGINYVKDPTSAFEDNVGTASIDFLQFPYQTLMYRGGDCDDLSILVCSLFESIGIKTAFITIPGHIYMAFDTGLTLEEAKDYFISLDDLIIDGNEVWVPLEVTLSDEGFNKAWYKGAWEWNTAKRTNNAMLYKMEDSWKIYKPVNVPGATAKFTLPEETYVAKLFSHAVDEFVMNQITPQVAHYQNLIAKAPTQQNYNDFGVLYAKYGLFEKAEKQFRLARKTNYLPALLNTANLYYSIKDYDRATNWYNEVFKVDSKNSLAMLGLARCAYEKSEYQECDYYYSKVYEAEPALARKYSYLGGFEQTSGRSFSLADRLENTLWLQSKDYSLRNGVAPELLNSDLQTQVVLQNKEQVPEQSGLLVPDGNVAIVPSAASETSEEKDEKEEQSNSAGDGDGNGNDPEKEPASYTGISSQLDFNILTAQDLAALAAEAIKENGETLDDFDASSFSLSVQDDEGIVEKDESLAQEDDADSDNGESQALTTQYTVTSVITDVPVREVPRFTEQPSEEWAPKEAYEADTIPGMKSFDEEMGNYQNDKAFLYKDEYSFAVNPGEAVKDDEEQMEDQNTLEVNPFSSFLSAEDSAKMEQITSFKLEDVQKPKPKTTKPAETKPDTRIAKAETKPSVVATKPAVVDETKPAVVETKPAVVVEEKPVVVETKPAVIEEEKTAAVEITPVVAAETKPAPAVVEEKPAPAPVEEPTPAPAEIAVEEQQPVVAAVEETPAKPETNKTGIIAIIIAALAGGAGVVFGLKKKNKRKGK